MSASHSLTLSINPPCLSVLCMCVCVCVCVCVRVCSSCRHIPSLQSARRERLPRQLPRQAGPRCACLFFYFAVVPLDEHDNDDVPHNVALLHLFFPCCGFCLWVCLVSLFMCGHRVFCSPIVLFPHRQHSPSSSLSLSLSLLCFHVGSSPRCSSETSSHQASCRPQGDHAGPRHAGKAPLATKGHASRQARQRQASLPSQGCSSSSSSRLCRQGGRA